MSSVKDFHVNDRVRWLHSGEYRTGTVISVGHKYVHVHADHEQRSHHRQPFTRTLSMFPAALVHVDIDEALS